MPVQKLTIAEFLQLAKQHPVFDVRSPGEYVHAHIPGAISLPLFTDEERKVVGTAYKQESKQTAIKIGLDYFGVKMRSMVEQVEAIISQKTTDDPQGPAGRQQTTNHQLLTENSKQKTENIVLVHCWRGGMRSAGVAWLLDLYGYKVYTLVGGYKVYRKWVLAQFEKDYDFKIIGGYTGSGKTLVLQQLAQAKQPVIDLEALANHKGSAFGALGEAPQPRQEMFENLLAGELADTGFSILNKCIKDDTSMNTGGLPSIQPPVSTIQQPASSLQYPVSSIFIEDESQRIGNLQIPMLLWNTMRKSPVYFLDIPFEERLGYIVAAYGKFEKEELINAITRLQKRLGGLDTKNAINYLLENDHSACFRILLTYYDKSYTKALQNRENLSGLLNKIPCSGVDTVTNTQNILACHTVNS